MKKHPRAILNLLLFIFTLSASVNSLAYMSTAESGELVPSGQMRLGFEPQFVSGGGTNLSGYLDGYVNESSSFRLVLGSGDTDFQTGLYYKFIPFPDFDNQPAMGVRVGFVFGRDGDTSALTFVAQPLISKKFDTEIGRFTPYASLPFGSTAVKSESFNPIQLTLGSEYFTPEYEKVLFGGEVSFDIQDSFSYISFFVSFAMDDERGIQFK